MKFYSINITKENMCFCRKMDSRAYDAAGGVGMRCFAPV